MDSGRECHFCFGTFFMWRFLFFLPSSFFFYFFLSCVSFFFLLDVLFETHTHTKKSTQIRGKDVKKKKEMPRMDFLFSANWICNSISRSFVCSDHVTSYTLTQASVHSTHAHTQARHVNKCIHASVTDTSIWVTLLTDHMKTHRADSAQMPWHCTLYHKHTCTHTDTHNCEICHVFCFFVFLFAYIAN